MINSDKNSRQSRTTVFNHWYCNGTVIVVIMVEISPRGRILELGVQHFRCARLVEFLFSTSEYS